MSQIVSNIALFIDADNIASRNASSIIEQLSTMGKIIIKRAYGNWSKLGLKNWLITCQEHCISTVQVSDYIIGKNSSDIQIVIDVMQTLYTKNIDIFVLVTSDSDFTNLVVHLVEEQKHVFGFGSHTTPKSLINAYSEFRFILDEIPVETPSLPSTPVQSPPPTTYRSKTAPNPNFDKELIHFIGQIIDTKGKDGALNTAILGSELRMHKTIDIGKYGFGKVGDLLKVLNDFHSYTQNSTLMVARKQKPKPLDKQDLDVVTLDEITLTNAVSQAVALHQDRVDDGWVGINLISQHLQANNGIANMHFGSLFGMIKKLSTFQTKHYNGMYFVKDARHSLDNVATPDSQANNQKARSSIDDLLDNLPFMRALRACIDDVQQNGWSNMAQIGSALNKQGFTPKQFGYKNLTALIKALDIFELKLINGISWVKAMNPQITKAMPTSDEQGDVVVNDNTQDSNTQPLDNDPSASDVPLADDMQSADYALLTNDTKATDTAQPPSDNNTPTDQPFDELALTSVLAQDLALYQKSDTRRQITPTPDMFGDLFNQLTSVELADKLADDKPAGDKPTGNKKTSDTSQAPADEPTSNQSLAVPDTTTEHVSTPSINELMTNNDTPMTDDGDDGNQSITQTLIDVLSQIDDSDGDDGDGDDGDEIALEEAIAQAIVHHQDQDGWATIGNIGLYMRNFFGLKIADMGYRNFGELIATLPECFELKKENRQSFARIITS